MWRKNKLAAFGFLLPALALLGLFVLWPTVRALLLGFQDAHLLKPGQSAWAGMGNYRELLAAPRFRAAFLNTAYFVLLVVPLQTAAAFFVALWVNRPERAWRWLRVVFFVPVVVSMPVLAVLWTMLYQPVQDDGMGLINRIVTALGLPGRAWLRDPALAMPAIAFMSIWQGLGLQMMIFLAGLQGLSAEQIEAAKIDGASAAQRLWFIVVPNMRNSFIFNITVTMILAFRLFVQPMLMTGGGPDGATLSIIQYIYEITFKEYNLGMAGAAAILFLLLVGALTLAQRLTTREVRA